MNSSYINESGVFINKYGINDNNQLNALEYQISDRRIKELIDGSHVLLNKKFNLERLQEIHQHIFQDVYDWAGKIRTTPSSKRAPNGLISVFSKPDLIVDKWKMLDEKTNAFTQSQSGIPLNKKIDALVDIFSEANHIHPFPEGNGRSLQVFIQQLAKTQSINLDFSKIDSQEWNNASSLSGIHGRLFEKRDLIQYQTDKEPIRKIFHDIAKLEQQKDKPSKEVPSQGQGEKKTSISTEVKNRLSEKYKNHSKFQKATFEKDR